MRGVADGKVHGECTVAHGGWSEGGRFGRFRAWEAVDRMVGNDRGLQGMAGIIITQRMVAFRMTRQTAR